MRKTQHTEVPDFRTLEEEREYWEARGPLAEGHKGRANRPKLGEKHSSILAVRLTGEEITNLRDQAAERGLGPSTYARLLLTSAMASDKGLGGASAEDRMQAAIEKLPQSVKDGLEALVQDVSVGGTENPSLIVIDASQMQKVKELMLVFYEQLVRLGGGEAIRPNEDVYRKLRDRVKA